MCGGEYQGYNPYDLRHSNMGATVVTFSLRQISEAVFQEGIMSLSELKNHLREKPSAVRYFVFYYLFILFMTLIG